MNMEEMLLKRENTENERAGKFFVQTSQIFSSIDISTCPRNVSNILPKELNKMLEVMSL